MVLCFVVNSVIDCCKCCIYIFIHVKYLHTSMSSTVVWPHWKFSMKTSSAILQYYISYQDVTYDLFFYLSDFDLFVKFKNKWKWALIAYLCCWIITINSFRVVFALLLAICLSTEMYLLQKRFAFTLAFTFSRFFPWKKFAC